MKYETISTASLIDKCLEKDPIAWAEFVKRFSRLMQFAIKKTLIKYLNYRADEDIKDIQQNLLTSLWTGTKLAYVKKRNNISYWLVTVSKNAALDFMRAKQKEISIGDVSADERFLANENDKAEVIDADEKIKKIYNMLTIKEKIIFKLYFTKSQNVNDISKMLGIPIGSVTSRITRMRKKIKNKNHFRTS